jgi:polyhydroxyalkanoate synthesis regulator phasin
LKKERTAKNVNTFAKYVENNLKVEGNWEVICPESIQVRLWSMFSRRNCIKSKKLKETEENISRLRRKMSKKKNNKT